MHVSRLLHIPVSALLAVSLSGLPAPAIADDDHDWSDWADCDRIRDSKIKHCSESFTEWQADGKTIRVDAGMNGSVSVVGWDKNMVKVQATLMVRADSQDDADDIAADVKMRLEKELITASGPKLRHGDYWSVTFRVWVPRNTDLDLLAENGGVGVRNVEGKMRLSTHNGPLSLRDVSGDVLGRTQNGPLAVDLEGSQWRGKGLDAETHNGPVVLHIPENYSAVLESGTFNGPWDVDIPVRVKRGRWFTAELGKGGAPVRVVTHNGPVNISLY